jgi:oligoribonuclease NrnB/cAMP/cGMP phosphodiesterase (DHH superfamily)
MPLAIKLLGEYDTWRNDDKERWENEILPFQFGMRMICNSPETFPENAFALPIEMGNDFCGRIIKNGRLILEYQRQINATACRSAFEIEFEGLRAICLNGGGFNSDVFRSVYDETKHDIMMPFQFNGKFWTISMYSTKPEIDASVIAKKYKGGGHKSACGFTVESIETVFGKDFENIINKQVVV